MKTDLQYVLVLVVMMMLFVGLVNSQQQANISTTTFLGFDAYSDGIPGLQASLFQVSSILVTPDDDLLLAESGSGKIRFYNKTSATIKTVVGQINLHPAAFRWYNNIGPFIDDGSNAMLLMPQSMIYGTSGEIIVTNTGQYTVRNISFSANTVTTIAGTNGIGAIEPLIDNVLGTKSYLRIPYSLVLSNDKQFIYILENLGRTIRKLEISTLNITTLYGDGSSTLMMDARSMALHPSGSYLYFSDTGKRQLFKLDLNGNSVTSASIIVGNGYYGYSPDGTLGVDSMLEYIYGIAVSSSKIYFSTGHRVAYYSFSDLKVYTLAGGTSAGYKDNNIATNCLLNNPDALALSRDETVLYISDVGNGRIRKLDLNTSILTTIVGYGGEFAYGNDDASPIPLFYDNVLIAASASNFFYADGRTFRIRQINNGTVKTIYDGYNVYGTGIGGMGVHPSGELYFTDLKSCYIKKMVGSNVVTVAGNGTCLSDSGIQALTGAVNKPILIAFVPNDPNTWYFVESEVYKIKRYSSGFIYDYAGGGGSTSEGILASDSAISPTCLTYYNGSLYFCESSRIRRIDLTTNQIYTVVGLNMVDNTDGAVALNATVSPTSIAFTSSGELFFTDSDRVKYVYNGTLYFFKSEHSFKKPQQITITQNTMYLFDSLNTRIEKIVLTCSKGILGANLTCTPCTGNYTNNKDYSQCIISCFGKLNTDSKVCNGNGGCIDQNYCECNNGYEGQQCEYPRCYGKLSTDPGVCSGVGACSSPNNCTCKNGYSGSQCESFFCFGTLFNSSNVCSSKGNCIGPNTCSCNATSLGPNCNITTCSGVLSNSSSVCSGKGSCLSFNNCQCNNGYLGNQCEQTICYGKNSSDSSICSGNGLCSSPNNCACFNGYSGSQCDSFSCFGKLPYSPNVCSSKGICIGPNSCSCNATWLPPDCTVTTCNGILSNSSSVCSGKGSCLSFNNCSCPSGYSGNQCEIFSCYGTNSSNPTVCNGNGKCVGADSCQCSPEFIGSQCERVILYFDVYNQKLFANASKLLSSASPILRAYSLQYDFYGDGQFLSQLNIAWDDSEFTIYYDSYFAINSDITILGWNFSIIYINDFLPITPKFFNSFRYYPIAQNFEFDMVYPYSEQGGILQTLITSCVNCSTLFTGIPVISNNRTLVTGLTLISKDRLTQSNPTITIRTLSSSTTSTFYFTNNIPEPIVELDTRRGVNAINCLGYHCVLEYSGVYPTDSIVKTTFSGSYSIRNSNKTVVRLMNYNAKGSAPTTYYDSIRYGASSSSLIGRNFSYPLNYIAYNIIPLSLSFVEKQQSISKAFTIKSFLADPYVLKATPLTYTWTCFYKSGGLSYVSSPCPKVADTTQLVYTANYFSKVGTLKVVLTLGTEQVTAIVNIVNQDVPQITTKSILPKISPMNQPLKVDAYIQTSSAISSGVWNIEFGSFANSTIQQVLASSTSSIQKINDELFSISLNINGSLILPLEKYIITLNVTNVLGGNSYIKLSTLIDRPHIPICSFNKRELPKVSSYSARQENDIDIVSTVFVFYSNNSTKRIVVSNALKHSFSMSIPLMAGADFRYTNFYLSQHGSIYKNSRVITGSSPIIPSESYISYITQQFSSIQQGFPSMSSLVDTYSILAYLESRDQVDPSLAQTLIPQINQYLVNLKDNLGDQIEDKILPLYITTLSTMFGVVSNKSTLEMTTELNYWLNWIFNSLKTAQQFYNPNLFSWLLVRRHVVELNSMVTVYSKSSKADSSNLLSFVNDLTTFSNIFVRDYLDDSTEIVPINTTIPNVEIVSESLATPTLLNSKTITLASSGISISFPKTVSSILSDDPISLVSYSSMSTNGSIGSVIEIQVLSQSKATISVNNLTDPIVINFPQLSTVKPDNKVLACLYFDTQKNVWSNTSVTTSVTIISVQNSITTFKISCYTTHLTQFGIFLVDPPSTIITPTPPVVNSQTALASNGTNTKKQSGDSTLGIVLGVVLSLLFIIVIVIIVVIVVVVLVVRKKQSPRKGPKNPHIHEEIIPTEDNTLIAATSQNEIAKTEVSLNDIEMNEVKPTDFTSTQTSTYQQLTESSSVQTSQHTTSDFPSAYISSYQQLSGTSSANQPSDFPSAYISSYQSLEGSKGSMNDMGSASSTTSNDPITSRYKDMVKIGAGGFGSVFKCFDTKANRMKAIKVMGFDSFESLNFMMKEATQLMNIKHYNIIKVNDMFISPPKLLCIDMELYENGDLMKYAKSGSICKETIVKQISYQMLDALNYVHKELKCCHRDVKPSNVFIREETEDKISIVLADFGLAKNNQNSLASYSGTPLYMSPEIALGSANYGNNVDIYSLGVSLYQIITKDLVTSVNHLYFTKDSSIVKKLLEEKMKASGEYSDELISIIVSMLEKDATTRPQAIDLLNNSYFDDQRV